jgi:hypothetical protein
VGRFLLPCLLVLGGCPATLQVSLTQIDAHTYDGYAERFGDVMKPEDQAATVAVLRKRAEKTCRGRTVVLGPAKYEHGFGGYGPIFGEGPTVRVTARVTCQ